MADRSVVSLLPLLLVVAACVDPPTDPKPRPVVPREGAGCPEMCAHLRQLGCETGKPTDAGVTCESFCAHTLREGFDLHPGCVVGARTCDEAEWLSQGCGDW